jgi:hypothetical protein
VRDFGFTGERRALALLPLCVFGMLYLVLAMNAQPGWGAALVGLALAYFVGFFALAAGWFWARWFASGLGWSGFMVGVMALVMMGWIPALGIYAGLHGLVVLLLMGPKMEARYELLPAWRERYGMDEFGVARLGKAVTRGAGALPTLILWALAPREEALSAVAVVQGLDVTRLAALGLLVVALMGFVKLRGYAVLGLAGAAVAIAVAAGIPSGGEAMSMSSSFMNPFAPSALAQLPLASFALAFVAAALAPWTLPLWRFFRRS